MLDANDGTLELQRNELANRMGCVPSQINYVITSRFTPSRGYVVESRRGGGGFVRITRIRFDRNSYLMHFYHAVGDELDAADAKVFTLQLAANNVVSPGEGQLILAALSDDALASVPKEIRDRVRAGIFKTVILKLI